ncbi:MAG: putative PEP-binding protein [Candidatus Thermoplasmatota archaeon]
MMHRRLLNLQDAPSGDLALLGGPASHLVRLIQEGVASVKGFAITQEALESFLAQDDLRMALAHAQSLRGAGEKERREALKGLKEVVEGAVLPWELEMEIARAIGGFPEGVWLAPSVDGAGLPVLLPAREKLEMIERVKELWLASLDPFSSTPPHLPLAAIGAVECETSGTASVDRTGKTIEIEAVYGLPHSLQDRKIERDRYILSIPDMKPRKERVAAQAWQCSMSEKGISRVHVSEGLRDLRKLEDEELAHLGKLVLDVRRVLNAEPAIVWGIADEQPMAIWVMDAMPHREREPQPEPVPASGIEFPVTATSLYMSCELGTMDFVPPGNVQGLLPVRAEKFVLGALGAHPLAAGDAALQRMQAALAEALASLGKTSSEKAVVVSLSDLRSEDIQGIEGAEAHEPKAQNPILGLRGLVRHLSPGYSALLDAELGALAAARAQGARNLSLLLPFVRGIEEAQQLILRARAHGLERSPSFKVWISIEVPANIFMAEEYAGICDGIMVNLAHLQHLISAIDPHFPALADAGYPDPEDEALRRAVLEIIRRGRQHGRAVVLEVDAPQRRRSLLTASIRARVDSVTSPYPHLQELARTVAGIEQRILLEGMTREGDA